MADQQADDIIPLEDQGVGPDDLRHRLAPPRRPALHVQALDHVLGRLAQQAKATPERVQGVPLVVFGSETIRLGVAMLVEGQRCLLADEDIANVTGGAEDTVDKEAEGQALVLLGQAVWAKHQKEPKDVVWERDIKKVWPTQPVVGK